jgi:hypothetical protein
VRPPAVHRVAHMASPPECPLALHEIARSHEPDQRLRSLLIGTSVIGSEHGSLDLRVAPSWLRINGNVVLHRLRRR